MPLPTLFWILALLVVIFGLWQWRGPNAPYAWGGSWLIFAMVLVLGWQVFGSAIKGSH
jgi:hypothetical protein